MAADRERDEIDGGHLPIADCGEEDIAPVSEVSGCIEDAGTADLTLNGAIDDDVDVSITPIREPETPEDVTLAFSIGNVGSVGLSLAEDEVLALCDQLHQALEVPKFDE